MNELLSLENVMDLKSMSLANKKKRKWYRGLISLEGKAIRSHGMTMIMATHLRETILVAAEAQSTLDLVTTGGMVRV